ncbi:hypothetical protein COU60_00375 [Candidatus Pacearchaeota archaeon CG10_big_fil_rev_8_21_14_0_10_34_76]|nr:MAG: hypothetical protein COU60_00375 [Candidatus Pacearchaeota archaeon CG10_big_fil_rev_8_21_14_0_10_34_76]
MRFNFRKIASAAASTLMVGSTVALAAAASYPAPFVTNGQADVGIVYGSSAQPTDLVAATDIATNLQSALTSQGGNSGGTPTGGDFVQLDRSSDRLNLGNAVNGPFGPTVDDDDLEVLLADGTYSAEDNDEFDYEQKITLGAFSLSHFRDSDYESLVGLSERTPVIGFQISSSNTLIANYSLDFTSDAESDVASGDLEDFEGSDIMLFGKKYYVSDAKNGTAAANFGTFTLLDSATTGIVSEGETISVTESGKTYNVQITFISSDKVIFDVNGETTNSMSEGETYKLSDGTYVSLRDNLYVSKDTGISKAEFSIGSGKLEITSGNEIKMNDDTVDGVRAWFVRGTSVSGAERLDKVVVEWVTDEEEFITSETGLQMPGLGGIKFTMNDFFRPTEETITVAGDSDTNLQITWPFVDGSASLHLLYANASGEFLGIGKAADERLATSANTTLTYYEKQTNDNYHRYFIASYNTTTDSSSYLLSANIREDTDANRNETIIKNEITGETFGARTAGDTLDVGDVRLTIVAVDRNASDEWMTISAGTNTNFNTIYTKGGLKAWLPVDQNATYINGGIDFTDADQAIAGAGHNMDTWLLFFDEEDKDDNIAAGTAFNLTADDNSDGDVHVTQVSGSGSGGPGAQEVGDSTGVYEAYLTSDVATRTLHYTKPDRDWAEVLYPAGSDGDSESYAEVFLAETSTSSGSGGSLGSVTVLDSEASQVSANHLIVVGGSCVNTVAAQLLGSSSPMCGSAFESAAGIGSGSYLIQTFNNPFSGAKVATLVAGYNAADTTNAAKALTTQTVDTTVGKKYTGTSSDSLELA